MNLPVLVTRPDCRDCDLGGHAKSPGLPMLAVSDQQQHQKALVIVGKAPGPAEDEAGQALVGFTGDVFRRVFLEASGLGAVCDAYLVNAVRCRLPNPKMSVPKSAKTACRKHLASDIAELDRYYQEVVVLASGAEALSAVYGSSVSLGKLSQGAFVELGGKPRRVFGTYLPTAIKEDPSKMDPLTAHLRIVREYVEHGTVPPDIRVTVDDIDRTSEVPDGFDGLVCVDTETYGACRDYPEQRFFHPQKSIVLDGVRPENLVLTVALAWRQDGVLRHRVFDVTNPYERMECLTNLRKCRKLLGQNIQFDVMYLRAWAPELQQQWVPFSGTEPFLHELMVANFWDSDARPERGLKPVSKLLGTADYDSDELNLRKGDRYDGPDDPRLLAYCTQDAMATLLNWEKFHEGYQRRYGSGTGKGSPYARHWYSGQLWLAISMSEAGVSYDTDALRTRCVALEQRLARYLDAANRILACRPVGEGSDGYLDELAGRCLDGLRLRGDRRVVLSEVTSKVSMGEENLRLFLDECGQDRTGLKRELRIVRLARRLRDLLARYYHPMLAVSKKKARKKPSTKPQKGPSRRFLNNGLINGTAYPSWRIVPSVDESGDEGGTQQVRLSAQGPAVQVVTPCIEACERSRWPGGKLVRFDMKQLEVRVPVLYTQEEDVAAGFLTGVSPYERAASVICGHPVTKKGNPSEYALGKMVVLAIQFFSTPKTLQGSAMSDLGVNKPLSFWEDIIRSQYANRPKLLQTQLGWIRQAASTGFLEVPFIGASRTFLGADGLDVLRTLDRHEGGDVVKLMYALKKWTYVSTIVNVLVQGTAAAIVLDAQQEAQRWLRRQNLLSSLNKNTHDEGQYDCPGDEVEAVTTGIPPIYRNPPYYQKLVAAGYYPVPLDCTVAVA